MADELTVSILLFLDFSERSKVRRVCRRLLNVIDAMPPPGTLLEVQLVPTFTTSEVIDARLRPWLITWDSNKSLVRIKCSKKHWGETLSLQSLPRLKMVRPKRLHLESSLEAGGVDVRLLRHLAVDVGATVTELSVSGLREAQLTDLHETFAKFDESGDPVKELHLSTCFLLQRQSPLPLVSVTFLRFT